MAGKRIELRGLIVSSSEKAADYLSKELPHQNFGDIFHVHTAGEARRYLVENDVDAVLINAPLKDEFGLELAVDIVESNDCGVLIFVKAENYEQVNYRGESSGVLTLARPVNQQLLGQALNFLRVMELKIKRLQEKNRTLQSKIEEIQLINRAKLLLMENLHFSEAQAHRYIEKNAMDRCIKRRDFAESIIMRYQ